MPCYKSQCYWILWESCDLDPIVTETLRNLDVDKGFLNLVYYDCSPGIQDPQFEWLDYIIELLCLFHGITEWLRLTGISGHHLVQPHCSYQSQLEQVIQGFSYHVSNVSKDGDITVSLCNLVQCLTILTVKTLLTLKCNFLYFNLCLMFLFLLLAATGWSLSLFSLHSPITSSYITAWHAFSCNLVCHQFIHQEEL